jgi:formylglycine-generating enzyme required for sulfatase activity
LLLLVLVGVLIARAIRSKRRPQFSLVQLLAMTVLASVVITGVRQWRESVQALDVAWSKYRSTLCNCKQAAVQEEPAHNVTITAPYYIGKYEVTQEQYEQVLGENPSFFKNRRKPVECVTWEDTQQFCRTITQQSGEIVRLPTDAEWERACRAGTNTVFNTGDSEADLCCAAWYGDNSNDETHVVGEKAPNVWGLYDMHGNVAEWCDDKMRKYSTEPQVDPRGPSVWRHRAIRGGAYKDMPRYCRATFNEGEPPDTRNSLLGFRVIVAVSP